MAGFFPAIGFGWAYFAVLVVLLLGAAYVDYRTLKIPKAVVFAILGTGLLANLIRGAWAGAQGQGVFLFRESNVWLGLLDGFLFSVVGFLAAFVLLFVLWILKTCGGGDVKLMAALGAWLGPVLVVYAWIGSVIVLLLFAIGTMARALLSGRTPKLPTMAMGGKPSKWRMSYSLPVAIATAVVLLWFCRVDLGLTSLFSGAGTNLHAN